MWKTESTIAELQEQLRQEKIVTNQFPDTLLGLKPRRFLVKPDSELLPNLS